MNFIIAAMLLIITIILFITVLVKGKKQGIVDTLTMWNILTFSYTLMLIAIVLTFSGGMNKYTYIYIYIAMAVVLVGLVLAKRFKNVRFINLWIISAFLLVCPLAGLTNNLTAPLLPFVSLMPTGPEIFESPLLLVCIVLSILIIVVTPVIFLGKHYGPVIMSLPAMFVPLLSLVENWPVHIMLFILMLTPLITIIIMNAKLLNYAEQKTEIFVKKYKIYKIVFIAIHLIFAFAFAGPYIFYLLISAGGEFRILFVPFIAFPYYIIALLPTYLLASFYNKVFIKGS